MASDASKFANTVKTKAWIRKTIMGVLAIACTALIGGPTLRYTFSLSPSFPPHAWSAYTTSAAVGMVAWLGVAGIVWKTQTWLRNRPLFSNALVIFYALVAATLTSGLGSLLAALPSSSTLSSLGLVVVCYLLVACAVQTVRGVLAGLKPKAYLYFVSFPATLASSTGLFGCIPLSLCFLLGLPHAVAGLAFVVAFCAAGFGLFQSLVDSPWEIVNISVESPAGYTPTPPDHNRAGHGIYAHRDAVDSRTPIGGVYDEASRDGGSGSGSGVEQRPLRIVQITDPHIGPFISIKRCAEFCDRVVALDPDLVLMTGDYCTTEAHLTDGCLVAAFGPLAALKGRVFATRGNHDHEEGAFAMTKAEFTQLGIEWVVDAERMVETRAGLVQIVGVDFFFTDKERMYSKIVTRYPPRADARFRIILLHDPGAARYVPLDDHALVLCGHTHGGQIGLVSCGLPKCTAVSIGAMGKIPDHGLWRLGTNRIYVNRGQGTRSMGGNHLVRLGVYNEASIMHVTPISPNAGALGFEVDDGVRDAPSSLVDRHDHED